MARVTVTGDFLRIIAEIKREVTKLARCQIRVGVLGSADGELLMIAHVHEFGATIKPKSAKNLAIPLKPSMRGKSPRDVKNTWVLNDKKVSDYKFIVRDKGKDGLELLFLLLPSVTIPERSFLRAGYDANKDLLTQAIQKAADDVIRGRIIAETAAHRIGVTASNLIKKYFDRIGPPKGAVTLAANPGKGKTLMQTGRLRKSITYEVTGL